MPMGCWRWLRGRWIWMPCGGCGIDNASIERPLVRCRMDAGSAYIEMRIRAISVPVAGALVEALTELLVDVVRSGASVSFMWPLERGEAEAFWRRVLAGVGTPGGPVVLVAEVDGRVTGSVQLHPAWPPNQPQRADVAKLLVHSDFRRRGIARALMVALEAEARRMRRTLLTLDTVTGSAADRLYRSLGYVECGQIPRYAMMPDGSWCATTIFYKQLESSHDRGHVWRRCAEFFTVEDAAENGVGLPPLAPRTRELD